MVVVVHLLAVVCLDSTPQQVMDTSVGYLQLSNINIILENTYIYLTGNSKDPVVLIRENVFTSHRDKRFTVIAVQEARKAWKDALGH